jgi:hypothetical protein
MCAASFALATEIYVRNNRWRLPAGTLTHDLAASDEV